MTAKNKQYYFIKIKKDVSSERVLEILMSFSKKKGIKTPTFEAAMVGNDFLKNVFTYKIWEADPIPEAFKNDTND